MATLGRQGWMPSAPYLLPGRLREVCAEARGNVPGVLRVQAGKIFRLEFC